MDGLWARRRFQTRGQRLRLRGGRRAVGRAGRRCILRSMAGGGSGSPVGKAWWKWAAGGKGVERWGDASHNPQLGYLTAALDRAGAGRHESRMARTCEGVRGRARVRAPHPVSKSSAGTPPTQHGQSRRADRGGSVCGGP